MGFPSCYEDIQDARGERSERIKYSRHIQSKGKKVKAEVFNVRDERAERIRRDRFAEPKGKGVKAKSSSYEQQIRLPSSKPSRRKPRRRKRMHSELQLRIPFPVWAGKERKALMFRMILGSIFLFISTAIYFNIDVGSHSGGLDQNGGHHNRKTGEYH